MALGPFGFGVMDVGSDTQSFTVLAQLALTVILVEHNMAVVMNVCETIHVVDHGETIAQGTPSEIKSHPKVLAAYLGEEEPANEASA